MIKLAYPFQNWGAMRYPIKVVLLFCLLLILPSCRPVNSTNPKITLATATGLSTSKRTQPVPISTSTPSPSPTSTATSSPKQIQVLVWASDPVIPILNYHRFTPNRFDETSGMVRYLGELETDLQSYYDAGYSLISLDDLLGGNIRVPEGRRPLILTIDDAYFSNQFSLDEQGQVSDLSAVGAIYHFCQNHPDFGFELSMFANFGDKYYGNLFTGTWWYVEEGWQQALADTIIWGIEHHVYPYNHTFTHPHLDQLADTHIQSQLSRNDDVLREYLTMAGHPEYASRLSNYIALPYGSAPCTEKGVQLLTSYVNPEGSPVRAVFEAGYEYKPTYSSAPFSAGFDPMHLPRMAAIPSVIRLITEKATSFPAAQTCELTVPSTAADNKVILHAIEQQVSNGSCPEGVYILEQGIFIARGSDVTQYFSDY